MPEGSSSFLGAYRGVEGDTDDLAAGLAGGGLVDFAGTVGLSGAALETGKVKGVDATVPTAGPETGGAAAALTGAAGFEAGLETEGGVAGFADESTGGGLAGAPGTWVGREGAFNSGLLASTLMTGLLAGAAGVGSFGFGFAGGKRKKGIKFPRLAAGVRASSFKAGTAGPGLGFADPMGGGVSAFRVSTGKGGVFDFSTCGPEGFSSKGGACPNPGDADFSPDLRGGSGGGPGGF
jgi:hypothetical protein